MLSTTYQVLKSGSDIRGIAADGVPGQDIQLTDEVAKNIGYGFACWLEEKTSPAHGTAYTVAVGHDSRISADRLTAALVEGLTLAGVDVKCCGLSSTPAMFMTTVHFECDAAVEITASHHPFNRNGFKFFTKQGGIEGSDVADILTLAENAPKEPAPVPGTVSETPFMNNYAELLRNMICEAVNADDYARPLRDFRIAVDAGNGAGGFYATRVLEPLGADITGSQFLEPDGMFPNHVPNPEDKTAMEAISTSVKNNQCDLGIIFDTDVDRSACVDENGREINRNALIALAAAIALEGNEGGTIVTDSVTSSGLKTFIEETLGGVHCRYKRGYRNVINEAKRLNLEETTNAPLAIETSGHAAMRENYFLDDGAYLATKIIIKAAQLKREGRTLGDLIADLKEPVEEAEYRLTILPENFREIGLQIIDDLTTLVTDSDDYEVAPDNAEGIRASKPSVDGWFLLRLSVHDPVMPLNIESNTPGGVNNILRDLRTFFRMYEVLDTACLQESTGDENG